MTDLLALLDSDPAAGILAVADLREQRAKAATPGPWLVQDNGTSIYTEERSRLVAVTGIPERQVDVANGLHIVAEANPAHALAAVHRWRITVDWWQSIGLGDVHGLETTPCRDCALWQATVAEVRAYLGGAA